MGSAEVGIAIVSLLTFLGLVQWLLAASWKTSRAQAALILFCASTQLVVAMLALYFSSFGLLAFSAALMIAYMWVGFIGAERFAKGVGHVD